MYIKKIKLENFRNYRQTEISLNKGINIFYGNNAQGKTNLLEAIFLCSIGKSFRTKKDKELIHFQADQAKIEIEYQKEDRCGKINVQIDENKKVQVNGIPIRKISEMMGNIYTVLFTPDDIHILKNGPAKRRKFLDIMISQVRPRYLKALNQYNRVLSQRNSYLKQIRSLRAEDNVLEIWDENLANYGEKIFQYRTEFIQKIGQKIDKIHETITNQKEKIAIEYMDNFKDRESFLKQLKKNRDIDIRTGMTNAGIQRDDFIVWINENKINQYGSQGQHRTAVLSLKISELEIMEEEVGERPILLLDDFMSELDASRRENLLKFMQNDQVIITGTEKDVYPNETYNMKFYYVEKGKIVEK